MDLQSCWECSSTCYVPMQCQTTTIQQPTCCHTPTCWPNIAWESAGNQDLRHETCLHVAVKVWWMDLQSYLECSLTFYTPIQCQTTTIAAPTCCHTPTWWPNIAWESAEIDIFSWSAWKLPTWVCKTCVAGVHHSLIYIYNEKPSIYKHLDDGKPPSVDLI